jgi:tRNA A-37 threonylcarbamoyl transferase component Bud32
VTSADVASGPELVGGRFEIRGLLASGGEAEVHLARDLELDLDVVIKTRRVVDDEDLSRLRREAGLLMRLVAHSGLPTVRSDIVDGNRYFMISDHVAGNDLRTLVEAQNASGLGLPTVLGLIDQLADTLDHLHGHQPAVVHGDVKPENVIVTGDGRAVLVDFGAAMRVGDDRERLGTPGFSAPEVLAGEALSPAADVYSLAALTVYLLTGIVPKLGTAWPDALATGDLVRLERVVRRGLTWDPLGRPWRASDFALRLREAAEMDVPTGTITLVVLDHAESSVVAGGLTALERSGGRHVTSAVLPPSQVAVAFPRARDATAAALDIASIDGCRVALHAGDLGGWHGATVQQLVDETVSLIEWAPADSVVCSPPVRMLLGADDSFQFEQVGARSVLVRLASSAVRSSTDSASAAEQDLDSRAAGWLAARRTRQLAGRERELRVGAATITRGRVSDVAPLFVVVGEPGIGKTRILTELAGRGAEVGDLVLIGRCTESGGAFEPFLDALGGDLFPFEEGHLERDEEGWVDRRRFFARIASTLRAFDRPVTLVLDDVQWIDGSSLALLAQLLDDLGGSLAVLAGCRPGAQRDVLDQLTQRAGATVVSLGPLDREAIVELAEHSGLALSPQTIDGVHALSAGNPFFAVQLLGHLTDAADRDLDTESLPVGVREWILDRVDRLGDRARDTLAPAAVAGRSFEVVLVADVLGVSPLEAVATLDAATAAGLLVDGDHPGEFRFVHAIVRSTLESSLSATRQALLHAAIARRIEEERGDPDRLEAAMHHWFAADRLGDPLHAGEVAAEVATLATERLAHERAISILDRALDVLAGAPATSERDRVEARLRLAHGRADFVASRNSEGVAQLYRAADLAETAGDPVTLAEAALIASLNRRHGLDDPELLRLLERASNVCPSEPAVLPAMLHIRQSRLLPSTVRHEERSAMARLGLVDVASMDPVDRATVETEVARACWSPDDALAREALTTRHIDEATRELAIGGHSRWTGVLVEALNHRWAARMQLGNITGALADAEIAAAVADEAGTTFLLSRVMMGKAMIHATLGNNEEAERLAHDAVAMSNRHNLVLGQMAITYSIGRNRGQQLELSKLERQLGDLVDSNPMFVGAFALVHAEAGQFDDARRLLAVLEEWAPWPRNWVWLATTTAVLEASLLVGDRDATRRYSAVLARYSGLWAMAAGELACLGPVDRVLGLAHLASGRPEQAEQLLTSAREHALDQGATPWVVRCDTGLDGLKARTS